MQLHNNYYFYKSVIDKKTCEKIIETGMSEIKKYKELNIPTHATTFGNVDKVSRPDAIPQNDKTYEEIKKGFRHYNGGGEHLSTLQTLAASSLSKVHQALS